MSEKWEAMQQQENWDSIYAKWHGEIIYISMHSLYMQSNTSNEYEFTQNPIAVKSKPN